jgi:hypothetical protein
VARRTGFDRRKGFSGSVSAGKTTGSGSRKTAAKLLKRKGTAGNAGTGRGRGVIDGGTADVYGRLPRASTGSGNYGGGYSGVYYPGTRPTGARRKG